MVKVLYVEDEPAQRELVNQLLRFAGVEVAVADNGVMGVEKAKTWSPDIILMDLRMPGMNGFDTIECLRDSPETVNIPVIILSAWTSAKLDERAISLGVARCIAKPFDLDDLITAINETAALRKAA
ncbi:MAG: response regulator [Anaerolineae bacterium]|nr:response regulator [Anaerolineae bacterium]